LLFQTLLRRFVKGALQELRTLSRKK